jgi:hypothetical protein
MAPMDGFGAQGQWQQPGRQQGLVHWRAIGEGVMAAKSGAIDARGAGSKDDEL